jgi:hypothetical protein
MSHSHSKDPFTGDERYAKRGRARRRDNDERGPAKSWTRNVFLRRRGVGPLCLHRIVQELERIHGWVKEGISLV